MKFKVLIGKLLKPIVDQGSSLIDFQPQFSTQDYPRFWIQKGKRQRQEKKKRVFWVYAPSDHCCVSPTPY